MSPKAKRLILSKEKVDLRKLSGIKRRAIDAGAYYKSLNETQRATYDRVCNGWCRELNILPKFSPSKMMLVRLAAINHVRLGELIEGNLEEGRCPPEGQLQKDIREALRLLMSITSTTKKKKSSDKFLDMRDKLREGEGLKPSKKTKYLPDGHDRRYHKDDVTRTEE